MRFSARGSLPLLLLIALLFVVACRPSSRAPTSAPVRATVQASPVVIQNNTPVLGNTAATAAAVAALIESAPTERPLEDVLAETPTPAPDAPTPPAARPVVVGIVQPTWELMQLDAAALDARVVTVDRADFDLYADKIQEVIDGGATVVITIGPDFQQETVLAAENNPDVKFIGIDQYQDQKIDNLIGLIYDDDRVGFLAGALAGMMTESNIVAAVTGPGWMLTMINMGEGFAAGAEYVNPGVDVYLEYHPGELPEAYDDAPWAEDVTTGMIEDGADVFFAVGGKTGQHVLALAKSRGLLTIGGEIDEYVAAPELRGSIATSIVKVVDANALNALIRGLADGSIAGGNVGGELAIAPFREAESRVTADVRERLATIERGLRQGSIKTEVQTR